jgi:uncharacterized membrane protein
MGRIGILFTAFLLLTAHLNAQKMNIDADSTAKCFSKEEITINSPVENVFKILSDINNWDKWQTSVAKAEIYGATEVGARFKWKAGGLNISSQLHTVNLNSEIGWTGSIWWIKAVHNWYLSFENNVTKVTVMESLRGFGASLMQKSLSEGMKRNLEELKKKAEKL